MQITRVVYLLTATGLSVASHLVIGTVLSYKDGKSQEALLVWFRAVRAYSALLALNMAANLLLGIGSTWGLILTTLGAIYLLYAMLCFLKVVRGW